MPKIQVQTPKIQAQTPPNPGGLFLQDKALQIFWTTTWMKDKGFFWMTTWPRHTRKEIIREIYQLYRNHEKRGNRQKVEFDW